MQPADLNAFLRDLEVFGIANDQRETDRSKKMLNLERDTAELVSILIRSSKARKILEIGTSNGFSTIWLAKAAGPDCEIVSIDRDPAKSAMARENLTRAGLLDRVDLRIGEATSIVAELEGPFDLVFFDGDRTKIGRAHV